MGSESQRIWFIFDHLVVSGPFREVEIHDKISQQKIKTGDLIWKRGQKEWIKVESWIAAGHDPSVPNSLDVWYVDNKGFNEGPFDLSRVAFKIQNHELGLNTKLWTLGLKRWVSVFEVQELVSSLGISRRKFFRAPLVGEVSVTGSVTHPTTIDVSAGGMCLKGVGFSMGQVFSVSVDSPLLSIPIKAKVKVVHVAGENAGLQFMQISDESHAAILEYIKQFEC